MKTHEVTYDLIHDPKGFVLVDMENGKVGLVDTGSPWNLSAEKEMVWGAKRYPCSLTTPIPKWNFHAMAESGMVEKLDYLIGTEALRESPFVIDTQKGVLKLVESLSDPVKMSITGAGAIPTVEGWVDRHPATFLVDTGAPVCFVPKDITWTQPAQEMFEDFYPLQGWFKVPARTLSVGALGSKWEAFCSDAPEAIFSGGLTSGQVVAILGMRDVLRDGRLGFDLKKGLISYERF